MRFFHIIFILASLPIAALAQTDKHDHAGHQHAADTTQNEPFRYVEQMAEAPYDVEEYLKNNIIIPATDAATYNYRVIVQFVVDEQGKIIEPRAMNAGRIPVAYKDEALRVVRNMPDWKPGMQNGQLVKVYYNLPISFKKDIIKQEEDTLVYKVVEQLPKAGYDVNTYINKNLQQPKGNKQVGKVVVQFVVEKDGSITQARIVGKRSSEALEKEALRVIMGMPKWIPGKHDGKVLRVYFTYPVSFPKH